MARERHVAETKGTVSGKCRRCGVETRSLKRVNGRLLCPSCARKEKPQ